MAMVVRVIVRGTASQDIVSLFVFFHLCSLACTHAGIFSFQVSCKGIDLTSLNRISVQ